MNYRNEFGLMRRKRGEKKYVWYYWTYDEDNRRIYRSTGQTSKAKALEYVMRRRDEGLLGEIDRRSITLNDFTKDMFIEGKCPIEREANARGRSVAGSTRQNRRINLDKHVLPHLGKHAVSRLTAKQINEWLVNLPETDKLSRTSSNQCMDALSKVMDHAVKMGIVRQNPCREVESLGNDSTSVAAFTFDEVKAVIGNMEDWKNPLHRLMCITASMTGMRIGEVLALQPCNVHEDRIDVRWNYSQTDGLRKTKGKYDRVVPISGYLYGLLSEQFPVNPEGFIFSGNGDKPYTASTIAVAMRNRCEELGIEGKSFHSFRSFVDTQMLAQNINESIIRKMIGHKDAKMTEHYLHLEAGEFPAVRKFQDSVELVLA